MYTYIWKFRKVRHPFAGFRQERLSISVPVWGSRAWVVSLPGYRDVLAALYKDDCLEV